MEQFCYLCFSYNRDVDNANIIRAPRSFILSATAVKMVCSPFYSTDFLLLKSVTFGEIYQVDTLFYSSRRNGNISNIPRSEIATHQVSYCIINKVTVASLVGIVESPTAVEGRKAS